MYKETEESIKGIVLDVYNITKNSNVCSISLYYKTLVLNTYRQIFNDCLILQVPYTLIFRISKCLF